MRDGTVGSGEARIGDPRWRRLTELRAGTARSVLRFEGQGSVAKATHAGLPWLRYLRRQASGRVHFWPFDGWDVPIMRSVVAEVDPSLLSGSLTRERRRPDQTDAYLAASWMRRADLDGTLGGFLSPCLTPAERMVASIEGWILGVP